MYLYPDYNPLMTDLRKFPGGTIFRNIYLEDEYRQ